MNKDQISALQINADRLRADIEAVNALGRIPGKPGVNRVSFSDADMAGRRWLMRRCEEAGLATRMDPVGNVIARWDVGHGSAVLVGSHLDTVPEGGPFDGTLGVCAALEAIRSMQDAGIVPERPVQVLCTADEEGRFGGMLGSQAICGEIGPDWIAAAVDDTGASLLDAMRAQGLTGQPEPLDLAKIAVFLELHIEQGPVLETAGQQIGVVTSVSGVFNWTVTLRGLANHSGTTPMDQRRDAFRGLADFGATIPDILATSGAAETRMTVGKVALAPNFPHSIVGEAVFSIVGRDPDESVMQAIAKETCEMLLAIADRHRLELTVDRQSWLAPVKLSDTVSHKIGEVASVSGYSFCRIASGAGHDAQTFARHVPAGLIFVPSVGGVSHVPSEWTDWGDIACGATLLARTVASYAICSKST